MLNLNRPFLLIIITITILFSYFSFIPSPVYAASLEVTPASGTVGSTVTLHGSDFTGRTATIYFNDKVIASDAPISNNGVLEYSIAIPNAPKGTHSIHVDDDSNWESSSATVDFTVIPGIEVFPLNAPLNSSISVTGHGFASDETGINITWDGEVTPHAPATANREGTWNTELTIKDTKGKHYVGVSSSSTTSADVEEVMVIVTPWSTVTPLSGTVGTKIIIEGWGFRIGEDGVTVTWDGDILLCNITAEADGRVIVDGSKGPDGSPRYELFVPDTTAGEHVIGLYGSSFTPRGILPDYNFKVIPRIKLDPESGSEGSHINITGTGFAGNETVTISYDGNKTSITSTANNLGSFSAVFKIPRSKGKEHSISASGDKGNSSTAHLSLESESVDAPQLLSPQKGAELTLFNSIGDVFGGTWRYLTGVFSYLRGTQKIMLPKNPIILDWSYTDSSGDMTYILQVSSDSAFTLLIIDRDDIDNSQYNLSETTILQKGTYYWRVKSIDSKGNESEWSDINQFKLISMPKIVVILSMLCILLIVAAIIFAVLFLRAQVSRY